MCVEKSIRAAFASPLVVIAAADAGLAAILSKKRHVLHRVDDGLCMGGLASSPRAKPAISLFGCLHIGRTLPHTSGPECFEDSQEADCA